MSIWTCELVSRSHLGKVVRNGVEVGGSYEVGKEKGTVFTGQLLSTIPPGWG